MKNKHRLWMLAVVFSALLGFSPKAYAESMMFGPYANVGLYPVIGHDNARVYQSGMESGVNLYGVSSDLAIGWSLFFGSVEFDFGGGALWYKQDNLKVPYGQKNAFIGHFFFDIIIAPPISDIFVAEGVIGFGVLFSGKGKNSDYALIQSDGADGHNACFGLKLGVNLLFNIAGDYFQLGPSFNYILGVKTMEDGRHDESTYYHYFNPGITFRATLNIF